MNQKHLLRFIKSKLKKEPDEVKTVVILSLNLASCDPFLHTFLSKFRLLVLFNYIIILWWQVVIFRDGKYMTLKEVFESLDLTGYAVL